MTQAKEILKNSKAKPLCRLITMSPSNRYHPLTPRSYCGWVVAITRAQRNKSSRFVEKVCYLELPSKKIQN